MGCATRNLCGLQNGEPESAGGGGLKVKKCYFSCSPEATLRSSRLFLWVAENWHYFPTRLFPRGFDSFPNDGLQLWGELERFFFGVGRQDLFAEVFYPLLDGSERHSRHKTTIEGDDRDWYTEDSVCVPRGCPSMWKTR
jgi:hypothetical protein